MNSAFLKLPRLDGPASCIAEDADAAILGPDAGSEQHTHNIVSVDKPSECPANEVASAPEIPSPNETLLRDAEKRLNERETALDGHIAELIALQLQLQEAFERNERARFAQSSAVLSEFSSRLFPILAERFLAREAVEALNQIQSSGHLHFSIRTSPALATKLAEELASRPELARSTTITELDDDGDQTIAVSWKGGDLEVEFSSALRACLEALDHSSNKQE